MLKKLLALLLAFCMLFSVATLLAACDDGGKKRSSSTGKKEEDEEDQETAMENFTIPSEGYDGSRVTIRFAHTMGQNQQPVLDTYIQAFNGLYPNITIEHGYYGGWYDTLDTISKEIVADKQPNVAYCCHDHVAVYKNALATVTLDDLISSTIPLTRADGTTEILGLTQEQIDDFVPGVYYEGKVYGDNLMYTMPLSRSTEVLYYNKTFFEENNLQVPATWEEMESVCRQIKEMDPTAIPLGYDSQDNMFITLCEQYGYDYTSATGEEKFLFNNDGAKRLTKEFRGWYQDGLMTTGTLYGAYISNLFTQTEKSAPHSYMTIGSSGDAYHQRPGNGAFEVGVAPIPQADLASPKALLQGPSLCILKGSSTTDQQIIASWLFIKFLTTNTQFQADFSMVSGCMPVVQSVLQSDQYAMWLNQADGYEYLPALSVQVGLSTADRYFTPPAFPGSAYTRQTVGMLLSDCISSATSDPDSYIDDAFEKAYQDCLKKCG